MTSSCRECLARAEPCGGMQGPSVCAINGHIGGPVKQQRDVTVCSSATQVHTHAVARHIHVWSPCARRRMEAGGALAVEHMTAPLRATQEVAGQCLVCLRLCICMRRASQREVASHRVESSRFCLVFSIMFRDDRQLERRP